MARYGGGRTCARVRCPLPLAALLPTQAYTRAIDVRSRICILNVVGTILNKARDSAESKTWRNIAKGAVELFGCGVIVRLSVLALGDVTSPAFMDWLEANMRLLELAVSGSAGVSGM